MTFNIRAWREANADRLREWGRRYRAEHRDEIRARQKDWRTRAGAELKASKRRYREVNRARILERDQARYAANRDRLAAERRASYARDPENGRAIRRRYVQKHKLEVRDRARTRYRANPESAKHGAIAWARANPERRAAIENRRRARELAAIGSHTLQEWREKVALFSGCCAYCGESRPLTRDHKVPLTRGGSDFITNVVPACHSCNCSKGSRTVAEFLARRAA